MKRKLLIVFLTITAMFCCAFGLTACNLGGLGGGSSNILEFTERTDDDGNKYYEAEFSFDISEKIYENTTEIEIPATHKKLPVKSITAYDTNFDKFKTPQKVILPEGIEKIWFNDCTKLSSINIPDSAKILRFPGCTGLKSINIPNGATEFNFNYCKGLTNVTISDGLVQICSSAFSDCTGLTSITIPDSVTEIGQNAFSGCTELKSITLPDSVTKIGESAFENCTGLKSIEIPEGVTEVGSYALAYCTGLTSITIPDSVTEFVYNTFAGCTELIDVKIPAIAIKALKTEDGKVLPNLKNIVITSGDRVDADAFRDSESLTSVTISEGVTAIEGGAFYGCTELTSITIPDSVTIIGQSAFYGCTKLKNINFSDNKASKSELKTIELNAFNACKSLNNIVIPEKVTYIAEGAFDDCESLKEVYLRASECTVDHHYDYYGYSPFKSTKSKNGITLKIDKTVKSIPDFFMEECSELSEVIFEDNSECTKIGKKAFYGCGLTNITIPEKVTYIGVGAFNCGSLMGVFLSARECSVSEKESENPFRGAGYDSTGITLRVNKTVKSIPKNFMRGCENLLEVIFDRDSECTKIGESAFYDCNKINKVSLGERVETIENYAFSGCVGLINIYFPMSIKTIGKSAFCECYKLVEIYNLSKVEMENGEEIGAPNVLRVYDSGIATAVFESGDFTFCADNSSGKTVYWLMGIHNKFAKDIILPTSVIMNGMKVADTYKIYGCAFYNSNVTSVTIPNNVTYIGGNIGLNKITFRGTKAQWEAIEKNHNWWGQNASTTAYIVYCTDGNIIGR